MRYLPVGAAALTFIVLGAALRAQSPTPDTAPKEDPALRPVAYIYGNIAITRADLGEFLMARGGSNRVDHLVSRRIIEMECKKRGIVISDKEIEAELMSMLSKINVKKDEFVKYILSREGKTYYEYMEDVIRPSLQMRKLCADRVKITDEEVRKAFDREYGEKRRVQMIVWPKGDDLKAIERTYAKIRTDQVEFDSAARAQANPSLAATAGNVKPLGRGMNAEEKLVEERAFQLKVGEVSEILDTAFGFVVIKLHEIVPPDAKVTFEKVKDELYKEAFEARLEREEIPRYFAELRQKAAPQILYEGPPEWRLPAARTAPDVLEGVKPAPETPKK